MARSALIIFISIIVAVVATIFVSAKPFTMDFPKNPLLTKSKLFPSQQHKHKGIIIGNSTEDSGAFLAADNHFFTVFIPILNNILNNTLNGYFYGNYSSTDSSVKLYMTNIKFNSYACDQCISMSLDNGQADLSAKGMSIDMSLDYKVSWHFLHSSGSCNPTVTGLDLDASVVMNEPTADGKPDLSIHVNHLTVGDLHLNCDGVAGYVLDAIATILKHLVGSIMNDVVSHLVTDEVNDYLGNATNLKFAFDNNSLLVNFNLVPGETYINKQFVQISTVGAVLPYNKPNMTFPFSPTPLKNTCSSTYMAAVGLSTYTFDTAAYSMFIMNRLTATFPNIIKAGDLSLLIHGFEKKLGKDALLNLSISCVDAPKFTTSAGAKSLSATVPLKISIEGAEQTSWIMAATGGAGVSLTVTTGDHPALEFVITTFSINNASIIYSNVGGREVALVVDFLDKLFISKIVDLINLYFKHTPMPLPSFEGLNVVEAEIEYGDDQICVATNLAKDDAKILKMLKKIRQPKKNLLN